MSEAFPANSSLKTLSVADCSLTAACVQTLSQALARNGSLLDLNLKGNALGDAGICYLCQGLDHSAGSVSAIGYLNLANTFIEHDGAVAIANLLSANDTLQMLSIRQNLIHDDGARAIAQAFCSAPRFVAKSSGAVASSISVDAVSSLGGIASVDGLSSSQLQSSSSAAGAKTAISPATSTDTIVESGVQVGVSSRQRTVGKERVLGAPLEGNTTLLYLDHRLNNFAHGLGEKLNAYIRRNRDIDHQLQLRSMRAEVMRTFEVLLIVCI